MNSTVKEKLLERIGKDSGRVLLYETASHAARSVYGTDIYVRGLLEISNYCRNDCFYCGIRHSSTGVSRYRLTKEEILECCRKGYELGFRTFVLQGGEDPEFTDAYLTGLVSEIREGFPDCAITLSLGERSKESYRLLFEAGANRYLLRHETADEEHYRKLHPKSLSLQNRKQCLWNLKEIGYQVGTGFMVGSPYQTAECIQEDLDFIRSLKPEMIGIGPFIHAAGTPFADREDGTLFQTLDLIAILRIMFPHALIPATTALGTIDPFGREMGILAGANVIMPNLSPVGVRNKYLLYDNKICTGEEAAECRSCLERRVASVGYRIVTDRGDYKA
jgi:biotin synthase